jgi:ankyrin repeat protein
MTPLMIAVDNLDFPAVHRLLEQHADINATDEFGQTALHFAVDTEVEEAERRTEKTGSRVEPRADMTRLLLEHGADVRVRERQGETPLDWAVLRRHKLAEALLRQYGQAYQSDAANRR